MDFINQYFLESKQILERIDKASIQDVIQMLACVKKANGRLFILGIGGSAANASHAVNDFRKIVGIESYAPTDNVSELTARINDDGWEGVFTQWLKTSRLSKSDMVLIFSVGGGSIEKNVSTNLVSAIQYAKQIGAKTAGIVSRDGGYTAKVADKSIIIPVITSENTTPHAEAFQAIIWHLLVSHPALKSAQTKWEMVL